MLVLLLAACSEPAPAPVPAEKAPAVQVKAGEVDDTEEAALVTAEDGPWRIFTADLDTSNGKFGTFTEVGYGFVSNVQNTYFSERFQIPDGKFLSATRAWKVEIAPVDTS